MLSELIDEKIPALILERRVRITYGMTNSRHTMTLRSCDRQTDIRTAHLPWQ